MCPIIFEDVGAQFRITKISKINKEAINVNVWERNKKVSISGCIAFTIHVWVFGGFISVKAWRYSFDNK